MNPESENTQNQEVTTPKSLYEALWAVQHTSTDEVISPRQPLNNWVITWISFFIIVLIWVGVFYITSEDTLPDPTTVEIQFDDFIPNEPKIPEKMEEPQIIDQDITENNESPQTIDPITVENQIVNETPNTNEQVQDSFEMIKPIIITNCPDTAVWNWVACQELSSVKVTEEKTVQAPLPIDHTIFAAGWYNGKLTDKYIDDSWKNATIFDIFVNYTDKPVVLILGAYEPSIWNISITKWTRIEKIILGWYYNQEVAWIFSTIPVERHIYSEMKSNDFFYISKWETTKWSLKRYGNVDEIIYPNSDWKILIGNQSTQATPPRSIQWSAH